jgi:hypothetical protein
VSGRVYDPGGQVVANAQISVEGAAAVTTTNARGEFALDSLPSGTSSLVVRRLGYAPSQHTVDLTSATPAKVTVRLERAAQRLDTVVVSARAEALSKVGFEERKKRGMGRFLTPDDVARMQPVQATDVLRTLPGLRVVPAGNGRNTVQSSRDASSGGCVAYWVDGSPFREMEAGDFDASFPASQITAVEVYQPTSVPAQFSSAGQSSCTTVVVWTQASIRRRR